jgi:Transposase
LPRSGRGGGRGVGVGSAGGAARGTTRANHRNHRVSGVTKGAQACPVGAVEEPGPPHPQFVELARRIVRNDDAIVACIEHRLPNALVESINTKIRLTVRTAFGLHCAEAIIAMAMLTLSEHRPALPNR